MIEIVKADKQHKPTIRSLAQEFWPVAFASILTAQQIEYMMEMMYSTTSLEKQMDKGHRFAIASKNGEKVGYMSYEIDCEKSGKTKIHKLYISPNSQRMGVGKTMVHFVAQQALQANNKAIYLNVNKHNNKAIGFYNKHHFQLIKEEEIDIGEGFIMDDYVFELILK